MKRISKYVKRGGKTLFRMTGRVSKERYVTSPNGVRRSLVEPLEKRYLLAIASDPDQSLLLSQPAIYLSTGRVDSGAGSDLISISRHGLIEVALNSEQNSWRSRTVFRLPLSVPGERILGAVNTLLDQDAFDDLVVVTTERVLMLASDQRGSWVARGELPLEQAIDDAADVTIQPAVVPLGRDLFPDVVVPVPNRSQFAVLRGGSAGLLSMELFSGIGSSPLSVAGADLIGDASSDLVIGNSDGSLRFFEGAADGSLTYRDDLTRFSLLGPIHQVRLGDLYGDDRPEIIAAGANGLLGLRAEEPAVIDVIRNGDFSLGMEGWVTQSTGHGASQTAGKVYANSSVAQFNEGRSFLTSLSQTFVVPANPQRIQFDLVGLNLGQMTSDALPDAFEVSLLDVEQTSLVPTHRADSTAFANFAIDATWHTFGMGAAFDGRTVTLDISQLAPGTTASLVFDLLGSENALLSSAMIDNVRVTPDVVRTDRWRSIELPVSPFAAGGLAIADVDGDRRQDIVVVDQTSSALLILNGLGNDQFEKDSLSTAGVGVAGVLAAGAWTVPDAITDIAIGLQGDPRLLTPLVADSTIPTATLLSPASTIQLGTTESAEAALAEVILEFSEPMFIATSNTAGSLSNPASYRLYHFGLDGIDQGGRGDDVMLPIGSVSVDAAGQRATLKVAAESLRDPQLAVSGRYSVIALGADPILGLRDVAGNRLDGGQDFEASIEVIRNVTVDWVLPDELKEGELFTVAGNAVHYAQRPEFIAIIDWGDGQSSQLDAISGFPSSTFRGDHRYENDGIYSLKLTLWDESKRVQSTESKTIRVRNVAPRIEVNTPEEANEGQDTQLNFTASDAGMHDVLTATIDWGDGTRSEPTAISSGPMFAFSATHIYADDGVYPVRVIVSDAIDTTTTEIALAIRNLAPSFSVVDASAVVGQSTPFPTVTILDPGFSTSTTQEQWNASIDWGDGSGVEPLSLLNLQNGSPDRPTTAELRLVHTYLQVGSYQATLQVADDDGGITRKSFQVNVLPGTTGNACFPAIDFEYDSRGNPLLVGALSSSMWADWGIRVQSVGSEKSPRIVSVALDGGRVEQVLMPVENASKASTKKPTGIRFLFDSPTRVDQLNFYKVSKGDNVVVRWLDISGSPVGSQTLTGNGSSSQAMLINALAVRELEFSFSGTGGIRSLVFCADQTAGSTARITGRNAAIEGTPVSFELQGAGTFDAWLINWGDGAVESISGNARIATHAYLDGPSTARVQAFARSGSSVYATQPLLINVENQLPSLTIAGPVEIAAEQDYVLTLASTDAGRDTIQGWLIDWGDGRGPTLFPGDSRTVSHVYWQTGDYKIRAHAFDEDYRGPSYPLAAGSIVSVVARGDQGGEQFEVLFDDTVVGSFTTSRHFQTYHLATTRPIAPNQVKIRFTNDQFNPANQLDYNLVVDQIRIDGTIYETEAADVYSTGTWSASEGFKAGFRKSETLHQNGYFHFDRDGNDGTRIVVRASGERGDERFNLLINDRVVKTFNVSKNAADFEYRSARKLTAEQIRVAFTNDYYDPVRKIDRNLNVDYIQMDDRTIQTEDAVVFSNGTWLPGEGIQPGYGRGSTLHANGYFQYAEVLGDSPFDTEWVSNWLSVRVTPAQSQILPTIDFERSAAAWL